MKYPTIYEVGQAADLLGLDVFDLGVALRQFAETCFQAEISRVRSYEQPNFARGRRLLGAAIACDQAWADERAARMEGAEDAALAPA